MNPTTYTDVNGNIFNAATGQIITTGQGPFSAIQSNGQWIDTANNNAVLGPVALAIGSNGLHPLSSKQISHANKVLMLVIFLLLIIYLIQMVVKGA